ncbi:type I-E CRISPR-associated protein Cse2/CasB [Nocardia sp. NPDC004068]|uniref:type I-E CRISPR-associated protein Cse2/CasB n=1 Tax=Nocardia sp. NPDC004068 TaxID=3364303 RepID=UPI0036B98C37
MTTPTYPRRDATFYRARDEALEQFVGARVAALQTGYLAKHPDAVATVAKLRRGSGLPAGSRPEIWAMLLEKMPEILKDESGYTRRERDGAATAWEQAAHDALTLYSWHQRSRDEPLHRQGRRFGAAVRHLGERAGSTDAVRARFHALGTASTRAGRTVHLRALIGLLRDHRIPLDYGRLARDLRRLDHPVSARAVLLQWGRDYYNSAGDSKSPENPTAPDATTTTGADL